MLCVSVLQPAGPPLTPFPMLLSRLAGHMEEGPDLDLGNSHQTPSRGCEMDARVLVPRAAATAASPRCHLQAFWLCPSFLHSQTAGLWKTTRAGIRGVGGCSGAFPGSLQHPQSLVRGLSLPVTQACLEVLRQPSSIGKGGRMSLCGSPGGTKVWDVSWYNLGVLPTWVGVGSVWPWPSGGEGGTVTSLGRGVSCHCQRAKPRPWRG